MHLAAQVCLCVDPLGGAAQENVPDGSGVPMRCPTLPKAESAVCQAACLLGCRSLQDGCRVL
eukprot:scaffold312796_cov23-Tisochrysis_lutea.AAC.1